MPVQTQPFTVFRPGLLPRGLFVTFEGIEGSGKSTQVTLLARRIRAAGHRVVLTREPGGTRLGRRLRAMLLKADGRPIPPMAELFLYVADRVSHLVEIVEPAIERGEVVLCDRYVDATLAYQGHGRGLALDWILEIHSRPPLDRRPERTILLDLDPTVGLDRARRRDVERGTDLSEGRIEAEGLEFHRRVREGYLSLAASEPGRFRVLPADDGADDLHARVWEAIRDLFPTIEGSRS
jgi:dTMP kinase